MGDLENIKMIDRLINTITFWLAIVIAIILLVLAVNFGYEHLFYTETNDAQVKADINPVLTAVSGYVKQTRFEQDQEVKKGDTLAILENGDQDAAVISSYNGTIARKLIQPGQFLQASQTIANVVDKDQGKWVIASIPSQCHLIWNLHGKYERRLRILWYRSQCGSILTNYSLCDIFKLLPT